MDREKEEWTISLTKTQREFSSETGNFLEK